MRDIENSLLALLQRYCLQNFNKVTRIVDIDGEYLIKAIADVLKLYLECIHTPILQQCDLHRFFSTFNGPSAVYTSSMVT